MVGEVTTTSRLSSVVGEVTTISRLSSVVGEVTTTSRLSSVVDEVIISSALSVIWVVNSSLAGDVVDAVTTALSASEEETSSSFGGEVLEKVTSSSLPEGVEDTSAPAGVEDTSAPGGVEDTSSSSPGRLSKGKANSVRDGWVDEDISVKTKFVPRKSPVLASFESSTGRSESEITTI